jgi:hypothetical protein
VQRVDELVVDAPVDDVHRLLPRRRAHHHPVPDAEQVAALDQLNAHQPGQQRVLEIRRVGHAGGEHDDRRVGDRVRGGRAQGGEQPGRVVVHRAHPLLGEQAGERAGHDAPVLQHVADPRGHPHVVLEHLEGPVHVAHQVDARDVHPHAVGRLDPLRGAVVSAAGQHDRAGHDAVAEDVRRAVDVGEEGLERQHPLPHSAVDQVPLVGGDHPRHQVEREGPLLAVEGEGHPAVGEGPRHLVGPQPQLDRVEVLERGPHGAVGRPRLAGLREHLVPGLAERVFVEYIRHDRKVEPGCFRTMTSTVIFVSCADPCFGKRHTNLTEGQTSTSAGPSDSASASSSVSGISST